MAFVLLAFCGGPTLLMDLDTPGLRVAAKPRPEWAPRDEDGIRILEDPGLLSFDLLEPESPPANEPGVSVRAWPGRRVFVRRVGGDLFVDSFEEDSLAWAGFRFGRDGTVSVQGHWVSTPCIEELAGTVVLSSRTGWSEGVHFAYFLVGVDRCGWSARWFEWPVTLSGEVWIEG